MQLRESGNELRSTTGLTGDTVMEGGTVGRIDYTIAWAGYCFSGNCLLVMHTPMLILPLINSDLKLFLRPSLLYKSSVLNKYY